MGAFERRSKSCSERNALLYAVDVCPRESGYEPLATAGPNDWRSEEYCKPDVPTSCWTGHLHPLWLNYGETSNGELTNTNSMLTLDGQLYMARFAQRVLRLREVKREWLSEGDVMAGK